MSKRSIRLKEIQPNLKKSYSPSEEYFNQQRVYREMKSIQ